MIAEIATSAAFSLSTVSARGAGETARYVTEQQEKGREHLLSSLWIDLGTRGVFAELARVAMERSIPNWDGYGAEPIGELAYSLALKFLKVLPLGLTAPTIGADPDGQLTLEWYKTPHRTLSVSVDPHGDLHYAALMGPNSEYGTLPFYGEVPPRILELVSSVTA